MTRQSPRISVFPKCYFDELYRGSMDYLHWLRQAGDFYRALVRDLGLRK